MEKQPIRPLALILGLSVVFFVFFMLVSGAVYLYRAPSGAVGPSKGAVGVIEITGMIMDSKKTLARLEKFEESDQIKAVVLRLNSPGGATAPSEEIYQAVKNYSKPVVVSMSSVAASGAYYIACGAKKIFANPGTLTGSIGAVMEFVNLGELYKWAKVHRYSVKAGKFKDAGAEYRELEPEEKALMQGVVDDTLAHFRQAVVAGRKIPLSEVTQIADGRVFTGSQAKAVHLIDELGTLKDAVLEAAKMGNIQGKPTVVYGNKGKANFLEMLFEDAATDGSESASPLFPQEKRAWGEVFFILKKLFAHPAEEQVEQMAPGVYWLWRGIN